MAGSARAARSSETPAGQGVAVSAGERSSEVGDLSRSAHFNQNLAGNFRVRGDGECLVDVVDRYHVSDHLLDLWVSVQQRDGGVDFGIESKGAAQLYLLRHQGRQVDRSRLVGQVSNLHDNSGPPRGQ